MDAQLEIRFTKDQAARQLVIESLKVLQAELSDQAGSNEKRAKDFIPKILQRIEQGEITDAQLYKLIKRGLIDETADSSQEIKAVIKSMLEALESAIHTQAHAILLHNLQQLTDLAQGLLAGDAGDVPYGDSAAYHTRHDVYTLGSAVRTKLPGVFVYERLMQLQNLVSKSDKDLVTIAKQMLDVYEALSGDSKFDQDRIELVSKMKALVEVAMFGEGGSAEELRGGLMSLINRVDRSTVPAQLSQDFSAIVDRASVAVTELAATDRKDIKEMKLLRSVVQRELTQILKNPRKNYFHTMSTKNPAKRTAVRFLDRLAYDYQVDTGTPEQVTHYVWMLREAARLVVITSGGRTKTSSVEYDEAKNGPTRNRFIRVWEQLNGAVCLNEQNKLNALVDCDVKELADLGGRITRLADAGQQLKFGLRELMLYKLVQYDLHLESGGHLESTSGYHYRGMAEGNEAKRLAARDMFFAVVSGASDQTILSAMARFVKHSAIDRAVRFDGKGSEGEKQFAQFYIESCRHYVSSVLSKGDIMSFNSGRRQDVGGVTFDWLSCDFNQLSKYADYSDKGWLLQTVLSSIVMANPGALSSSARNCVLDGHTKKDLVRGVFSVKGVPAEKQVKVALLNFASAVIYGKADFETLKAVVLQVIEAGETNKGGVPKEYREIVSAITAVGQNIKNISHKAQALVVEDERPLSALEESMQRVKAVSNAPKESTLLSTLAAQYEDSSSHEKLAFVDRKDPCSLFAKVNKAWLGFNKEQEQEVISDDSNSDEAEKDDTEVLSSSSSSRLSGILSRRSQTEERPRAGSIKDTFRRGGQAAKKRLAKVGVRKELSSECWLQLNNVRLIAEHGSEEELYFALAELMAQTGRELQRFYPEFHAALNGVYQEAALQVGAVTPQRALSSQLGILGSLGGVDHGDESSREEHVMGTTAPVNLPPPPPSLKTDFSKPLFSVLNKDAGVKVEAEHDEEEEASQDSYNGDGDVPPPPPARVDEQGDGAGKDASSTTNSHFG